MNDAEESTESDNQGGVEKRLEEIQAQLEQLNEATRDGNKARGKMGAFVVVITFFMLLVLLL